MTGPPTVSVVVVSRGRPDHLSLCLLGLSRLLYPAYEIVVVADPAGMDAVKASGLADEIKTVPFDVPNISAARNAGIVQAAGEVVAFVDDDAVPEPTWLHHLVQGFRWPQAAAAGGFVRGRNGIGFQWRARSVDRTGVAHPLALPGDAPVLLHPTPDRAIKTEGTNMAVRRTVLADIGGFDPAYRFYLDETDLNWRLAHAGHATALVPLAQVHHAFAASPRRRADRAPLDLTEIGASTAAFLLRHAAVASHAAALDRLRAEQRRRLLWHMRDGLIEPRDVRRLLAGLEAGIVEGMARSPTSMPALPRAADAFRDFASRATGTHRVVAGRVWSRRRHRAAAAAAAAAGHTVSLYLFSPTTRPHRVHFSADGVWEQSGGLWGRSDRTAGPLKPMRFAHRLKIECERVRSLRQAAI